MWERQKRDMKMWKICVINNSDNKQCTLSMCEKDMGKTDMKKNKLTLTKYDNAIAIHDSHNQ